MTTNTQPDADERTEWLEWRRQGIGGSDIGALALRPRLARASRQRQPRPLQPDGAAVRRHHVMPPDPRPALCDLIAEARRLRMPRALVAHLEAALHPAAQVLAALDQETRP